MPISISIVEDDADIRQSLALVIRGVPAYKLNGAFGSAEEALREIPKMPPDVVLMDIHLPKLSGIECVRQLKAKCPALRIVMLTVFDNSKELFQSLSAGASGYLLKRTPPARILEAVEEVHQGGSPMSPPIARMVVDRFYNPALTLAPDQKLSAREDEVLHLLAKGYRYKEIADALNLSVATVHSHLRRIYDKLQVTSRTEAVVKFLQK